MCVRLNQTTPLRDLYPKRQFELPSFKIVEETLDGHPNDIGFVHLALFRNGCERVTQILA